MSKKIFFIIILGLVLSLPVLTFAQINVGAGVNVGGVNVGGGVNVDQNGNVSGGGCVTTNGVTLCGGSGGVGSINMGSNYEPGDGCRDYGDQDCPRGQTCNDYICAQIVNTVNNSSTGQITIQSIVDAAVRTTMYIASGIVVILWVVTGILFLVAQGDPGKLTQARHSLLASAAGTVLIVVAASAIYIISSAFNI